MQPHNSERDEEIGEKEFRKLDRAQKHGYVRTGKVKSITHYFSVPKGDDIRMVYNDMLIRFNTFLWDPHFALPTVDSTLRKVEEVIHMIDRDVWEMFLNFMLSDEVRPFCGVDVTNVITED